MGRRFVQRAWRRNDAACNRIASSFTSSAVAPDKVKASLGEGSSGGWGEILAFNRHSIFAVGALLPIPQRGLHGSRCDADARGPCPHHSGEHGTFTHRDPRVLVGLG